MRRLGQRIREEAERGCAVMLITHDMELVNNCCDRRLAVVTGC